MFDILLPMVQIGMYVAALQEGLSQQQLDWRCRINHFLRTAPVLILASFAATAIWTLAP